MLGGVDVMSMPALQDWFSQQIKQHVARAMTFPQAVHVPFVNGSAADHAAQHTWPSGIAVASVLRVHLPRWHSAASMPSLLLRPATWADPRTACDVHAMTYPLVVDPQNPSTMERWQAAFPVTDAKQALHVIVIENSHGDDNKGCPVTSATLPLAPLLEQPRIFRQRAPQSASANSMRDLASGPTPPVSRVASERMLAQQRATTAATAASTSAARCTLRPPRCVCPAAALLGQTTDRASARRRRLGCSPHGRG